MRVLVQTCAHVLRPEHGRWPSSTELLAYMAQALFLDLDEPEPYCEAARWFAAGRWDPATDHDFGILVLPQFPYRVVVPSRLAVEVEAWLAEQP